MAILVQLRDESASGAACSVSELRIPVPRITLRELIRQRIEAEVERYNKARSEVFEGLVQPPESERILNGYRRKHTTPLDAAQQFARACAAFEQNGFFVLCGERQIASLDEEIVLADREELRFIRLLPLIGG